MLDNGDPSAFLSLGPVWGARGLLGSRSFIEIAFNLALLQENDFDGTDLGGHLHFKSALSIGYEFEHASLALRFQHISNAGLNRHNPGMNTLGVVYYKRF